MYSAKPPHRPIAGMIPSDSSTWLSVSSSMPHLRTEVVNGQRGDREQDEVQGADEEVRDPEDDGLRTERRRRRECHDQHGGRCGEDRQSNGAFLGIDGVRQPGVRPPRSPQRGKQKRPAQQSFPGLVGCEEAGDLGDGEAEDEVEEQL
jgi:hypothetical protein